MIVSEMTHDQIAEWGATRVSKMGYPFAFANCTSATAGEQPDILGMNAWANSIVGEVKVSRSDFLADKKKPWRQPGKGMGRRRFYLTPEGLLKPEEIPYGWELWEVYGKKAPRLRIVKGPVKRPVTDRWGTRVRDVPEHCTWEELKHFDDSENHDYRSEAMWALKLLKRIEVSGVCIGDFSNNAKLKEMGLINGYPQPGGSERPPVDIDGLVESLNEIDQGEI